MSKKILKHFLLIFLWGLLISQVIAVVLAGLKNKFTVNINTYFKAYSEREFLVLFLVAFIGGSLYYFVKNYSKGNFKEVLKHSGGEYSHFLSHQEIKKSKDFKILSQNQLNRHNSGIVISTTEKGKKLKVILTKPTHTLLIGTTGSGKNVGYIDSNIYCLSNSKEKPSMVIADPKGENFAKHAKALQKNGYDIKIIDLREPYLSAKWNPFDIVIKHMNQIKELKKFNEIDYVENKKVLSDEEKVLLQELQDNIYSDTKDIIYTMFPMQKSSDMTWQEGARNLILAFTLALIEDIQQDKYTALREDKLIPYNIFFNISRYAVDNCVTLKEYINNRDKFSKVPSIAGSVLSSIDSDKTLASYLSTVQGLIQKLSDSGILALTAENEIDLRSFDEKPTAVFVVIPDEKDDRHPFATLLIAQIYKSLVYKAQDNFKKGETKDRHLKRHLYFILDEFGNLPKFNNLENMITVARSRKIFFELVVQSFEQLESVYESKVAKIVRGNCNLKVFLGTTEKGTQEEFSALCGKRLVESTSLSSSDKNTSASTSAKETALITADELGRLNNGDNIGNAISLAFGHYPIKSSFMPSYRSKVIKISKSALELERKAELFNEKEYVFDISDVVVTQQKKALNYGNFNTMFQNNFNNILKRKDDIKKEKTQEKNIFSIKDKIRWKEILVELEKYITKSDYIVLMQFAEKEGDLNLRKRFIELMRNKFIENEKVLKGITKLLDILNNQEIKGDIRYEN